MRKLTVSIIILHPPETRKPACDKTRGQVTGPCSVRRVSGTPRGWFLELTLLNACIADVSFQSVLQNFMAKSFI